MRERKSKVFKKWMSKIISIDLINRVSYLFQDHKNLKIKSKIWNALIQIV